MRTHHDYKIILIIYQSIGNHFSSLRTVTRFSRILHVCSARNIILRAWIMKWKYDLFVLINSNHSRAWNNPLFFEDLTILFFVIIMWYW